MQDSLKKDVVKIIEELKSLRKKCSDIQLEELPDNGRTFDAGAMLLQTSIDTFESFIGEGDSPDG